ncbi:VapE domain-containing protein [Bosea sp. PAMC 26642]|uniref:VapE domain-containing protein n=1 Tax=Bosea sp. (strain PAMC 26642) TaxID=1792307 RepID=UPI00076FF789|nr:VapE domain-containing protein [Bosea sp. PAMC 26642]AMJ59018.1 hypothetical protein AXW83_00735 [Bosea sp. PAMC 26642]
MSNAQHAQFIAAAGLRPFPCKPDKSPMCKWTTDGLPDHWLYMWDDNPDAMPGLGCGPAGLVVVDCDVKRGVDGITAFKDLCCHHGVALDSVPCVTTPSGGCHYYFRQPTGAAIGNSAGMLAPGVDVRGKQGYVIAPGAINVTGGAYGPLALSQIIGAPVLPDALAQLMRQHAAPATLPQVADVRLPQSLVADAIPLLEGKLPAALRLVTGAGHDELSAGIPMRWTLDDALERIATAPPGTRNHTLNREAFIALRRVGAGVLFEAKTVEALKRAALTAGLDTIEIDQTLASAYKAAVKAPAASAPTGVAQIAGASAASRGATGKNVTPLAQPAAPASTAAKTGSLANALSMLGSLGIVARHDTFADKFTLGNENGHAALPQEHCGDISDNALIALRAACLRVFKTDPGKESLQDAANTLAVAGRYNPVTDWLNELAWDGTPRLAKWLPRLTGAQATRLNYAAGVLLLMAMCARARYPGTKFDVCIVLEGKQGVGKSSLVATLAGGPGMGYVADTPGLIGMEPKQLGELLAGKWIAELSELSGLRQRDAEHVKTALTVTADKYRAAYNRHVTERQRTCVFVGTTNDTTYLPDTTGNRRFLPVACGVIDLPGLAAERGQLFAEAEMLLQKCINMAKGKGISIVEGKPLPPEVASILALPTSLWDAAKSHTESRRAVSLLEVYLDAMLADAKMYGALETLPDGRQALRTLRISEILHPRLPAGHRINLREVAALMAARGWIEDRFGARDARCRGYTKTPPRGVTEP